MTAVALDFCAEELELRGGREVGRCTIIEKTVKKLCGKVHAIGFDDFLRKREFVSERTTFLSLNQESVSRWSRLGKETEYICLNSLPRTQVLPNSQFASHAGASIFKSLPSVWQQLEGDFHCRLGRGKGSLLFWNTPSWRNPLLLITETLGYQHHRGKDELCDFL